MIEFDLVRLSSRKGSCSVVDLAYSINVGLGVHEEGNDETVETQDFGENENKNHADEETGLLSSSSNTSITNNTNGKTGSETSKSDGETSTELNETSEQRKVLLQAIGDKDGNDETVDTNDTGHNDGNNVLDDQVGAEDTHGSDTNTRLGGTVRGAKAGEDNGAGAAHSTKEGRVNGAKFANHLDGCLSEDKQISMGQYRFRRCIEGSENELSCWEMKSLDNRNRLLGG